MPADVDAFQRIPSRVFLDTCVVNMMLDHWGQLHNGEDIPSELPADQARELEALCGICDTGARAMWRFTISERTYFELNATKHDSRRRELLQWFAELWHYQSEFSRPRPLARARLSELRNQLRVLPDVADRDLILDAVRDNCQAFCTVDRRTIIKHQAILTALPLRVLTPSQWWAEIKPWAAVWL